MTDETGIDPLLQRAKLLIFHANANVSVDTTPKLTNQTSSNQNIDDNERNISTIEVDPENFYQFKAGVINGSSLITTYCDIRPYCKQGSQIIVNGTECRLKGIGGEWSINCVELQDDYPGETKFDSTISISKANNIKATHRHDNIGMQPVSSQRILNAVKNLSDITSSFESKNIIQKSPVKEKSLSKSDIVKNTLLKYDISATAPSHQSAAMGDERIQEELKKTQERIAEWKRKIDLKVQEDALLQQQPHPKITRKERHYYATDSDSKIPKVKRRLMNAVNDQDVHISKEEALEMKRLEEERRIAEEEAKFIANEKKVQLLREKTESRVQNHKQRLIQEQEEAKEQQRKLAEEKKLRADVLPQRRNRFMALKQETEDRLQQLAAKEEQRFQQSQLDAEKRLQNLAQQRGRQKPTAEWFQGQDDLPSDPSRWKDSHSAPAQRVLPPIYLTDNLSSSSQPVLPLLRSKSELTKHRPRPSIETSSSASQGSHSKPLASQLLTSNTSPKRTFPLNAAMAKMPASPKKHSLQPLQHTKAEATSLATYNQDDDNSDDSLHLLDEKDSIEADYNHDLKHYRYQPQQQQQPDDGEELNQSVISDVTIDDNHDLQSLSYRHASKKSKKRTGIPVWKLKPIAVAPYMPIPSQA